MCKGQKSWCRDQYVSRHGNRNWWVIAEAIGKIEKLYRLKTFRHRTCKKKLFWCKLKNMLVSSSLCWGGILVGSCGSSISVPLSFFAAFFLFFHSLGPLSYRVLDSSVGNGNGRTWGGKADSIPRCPDSSSWVGESSILSSVFCLHWFALYIFRCPEQPHM